VWEIPLTNDFGRLMDTHENGTFGFKNMIR
jgi:hypothetical protein